MKSRLLIIMLLFLSNVFGNEKLKVGVLAFGTVNWELDTLKHNNLDKKYGFDLEVIKLASKNAVSIALQSKTVDIIVSDWVWVNRQKTDSRNYSFYPYSKAIGALYVNNKSINSIADLKGKALGIAGGSVDKTWLLFRAYSKYKYNMDLKNMVSPIFAAPPFLYKKMLDKSLEASINFWHFNAKLDAKGNKRLLGLEEILNEFKIKNDIPMIGWIFNTELALKNKKLFNSFLQASYETKKILNDSNEQWNRIKPKMKAKDEKTFEALKNGYRNGIVKEFTSENIYSASKVFDILSKEGGSKLVGNSKSLDKDIFWDFTPNINW